MPGGVPNATCRVRRFSSLTGWVGGHTDQIRPFRSDLTLQKPWKEGPTLIQSIAPPP